jgi:myosin heavy subunit
MQAPTSVCSSFKASLADLVTKLELTQPNFVRCIAPNRQQLPNLFAEEEVKRQLQYTGVMETVRIRREGFAIRLFFDEFLARYLLIQYTFSTVLPAEPRDRCEVILSHAKCTPQNWQVRCKAKARAGIMGSFGVFLAEWMAAGSWRDLL